MRSSFGRVPVVSRRSVTVVAQAAAVADLKKAEVPLALEQGPMPLNTFNSKAPFEATVVSVTRAVGPKATGETLHIVIKTDGKIPYWEGQSYGVVPPVSPRCQCHATWYETVCPISPLAHAHTP